MICISNDVIEVQGRIVDNFPGSKFKVELENGHELTATLAGKLRKNYIKVLVGDKVDIEMSPYDLTMGRITYRYK